MLKDEIAAVLVALNQFASNYSEQEAIRWGLMVGPRKIGGWGADEKLYLISDIAEFPNFLAAFAGLGELCGTWPLTSVCNSDGAD